MDELLKILNALIVPFESDWLWFRPNNSLSLLTSCLVFVKQFSLFLFLLQILVEFRLHSLFELFFNILLVTVVRILGSKLVLTPMPICFCEVVLVTNTEIVSDQQSLELALAILWRPRIVFHAKRDTNKPFNSRIGELVIGARQIIE